MTGSGRTERTGGYYHLLKAALVRDVLVWSRYPVDAAFGLVFMAVYFALLFYGGRLVAPQVIEDSVSGLVVGYFLWTLSNFAYGGLTEAIQNEASWGTLERHFTTPLGFGPVILAKSVALVLRTFVLSTVLLALMLAMTGVTLTFPVVTVVVVGTFSVVGVLGLGLAIGGLTVRYKRIGSVTNLLQFAFVGLVYAPAFDLRWARFLPLVQGSEMLQRAMRDGVRVWEFDPAALAVLVGTAALYLVLGYAAFVLATRRARRLGVLGDY